MISIRGLSAEPTCMMDGVCLLTAVVKISSPQFPAAMPEVRYINRLSGISVFLISSSSSTLPMLSLL